MEQQYRPPPPSAVRKMLVVLLILFVFQCCPALDWDLRKLPCTVSSDRCTFDCSKRQLNHVPRLPTGICANATHLDLSENNIQVLSGSHLYDLRNLTSLDLGSNKLHSNTRKVVSFSGLDQLTKLILDYNTLQTFPQGLPPGLQYLSLKSNRIGSLKSEDFRDIPNIETIRMCSQCYLRGCPSHNRLHIKDRTFSNLTRLINLTLSYNGLKTIPQHLPPSLQKLKVKLNTIAKIVLELKHLVNLKLLDLSGNCPVCDNAPFFCRPCKTPRGELQIHPQAFASLSQLEELRLSGNSLQSIKSSWFKKLTSLQYLYMSFNSLATEIVTGDFFSWLPKVEVIDLSYNEGQTYSNRLNLSKSFSKLTSLKTLHLESYVFFSLSEDDLNPLSNLVNLSVLNFGTNFLQSLKLGAFHMFHNLSLVDLSENRLSFFSDASSVCGSGCNSDDGGRHRLDPFVHTDQLYRRLPPSIKPECVAYGPVLDLSRNSIISINPHLLQGGENIACLNLSYNSIGDPFNGSQFVHFPKLKYLDLSLNKIFMRFDSAFSELPELEVLDLSGNTHYFLVTGLMHSLDFLKHLGSLKTLNLGWNEISTLTNKTMFSRSLRELNFRGNRLDLMWGRREYYQLFKNLPNLTSLDLSLNKLKNIPKDVYRNLTTSLRRLSLSKNRLEVFNWKMLPRFTLLEELDLSKNQLESVAHDLSNLTKSLRLLDLSYNRISELAPGFLRGARSLQDLVLSFNLLQLINRTTFESGEDNHLARLSLEGNPLRCTCDLMDFHLWMKNNDVEIPLLATRVRCTLPAEMKGKSVLSYDIEACVNDGSAKGIFIATSFHIVLALVASLTAHLFYWDLSYTLEYLRAKLRHRRAPSQGYAYDAFIMYDSGDPLVSDWVLNHLRVELEERGESVHPRLCLEERDWPPGTPVMENLSNSVQRSRKTVFVVTEGFQSRGVVQMAALLVQQRLVEEGVDSLVLLLLQPDVLRRSRIVHLRRRLCSRSVLQWPGHARSAAQLRWFWHRLRRAVQQERKATHATLHGTYFTGR